LAYGLETLEEIKKRKKAEEDAKKQLVQSKTSIAENPNLWNPSDMESIRNFYSQHDTIDYTPPVQTPTQPTPANDVGFFQKAKESVFPFIGGAAESVGKPIARFINQISGADAGLTQAQMDRKYGLNRLLGREPTQTEQIAYSMGASAPMLLGGSAIGKMGLSTLGNLAAGTTLGGVAGAMGAYGQGAGASDIGKAALESAAFVPAMGAASNAARTALRSYFPNMATTGLKGFARGGLIDVAGGLGGTLGATVPRVLTSEQGFGNAPTSQEYLQNALTNLIFGRTLAGVQAANFGMTPKTGSNKKGINYNKFGARTPTPEEAKLFTEARYGKNQATQEQPNVYNQQSTMDILGLLNKNIAKKPTMGSGKTSEMQSAMNIADLLRNRPKLNMEDLANIKQEPLTNIGKGQQINIEDILSSPNEMQRMSNLANQPKQMNIFDMLGRNYEMPKTTAESRTMPEVVPQRVPVESRTIPEATKYPPEYTSILNLLRPTEKLTEIPQSFFNMPPVGGEVPQPKQAMQERPNMITAEDIARNPALQQNVLKKVGETPETTMIDKWKKLKDKLYFSYSISPEVKTILENDINNVIAQEKYLDVGGLSKILTTMENAGMKLQPESVQGLVESYSKYPTKWGSLELFREISKMPEGTIDNVALARLENTVNRVIGLENTLSGKGVHLDTTTLLEDITNYNKPIKVADMIKLIDKNTVYDSDTKSFFKKMLGNQSGAVKNPFYREKKKDNTKTIDKAFMGIQKYLNPPKVAKDGEFKIRSYGDKDPKTFDEAFRKVVQRNVDSKFSISKMADVSKDPYLKALAYNTNHVNAIADRVIDVNMVNMDGKVVGNSLRSVFKDLTNKQMDNFLQYQYNLHNIDRTARGVPIDETITPAMSLKNIKELEKIDPSVIATSKRWSEFTKKLLKTFVADEGIISEDAYQRILATNPNYIPSPRVGYTLSPNVLKRTTGSTNNREILNGVEVMIDTVKKFVSVAAKQRLYNRIYDNAVKYPNEMRPFVEVMPPAEKTMTIKDAGSLDHYLNQLLRIKQPTDLLEGRYKNIMVNGEMKKLRINDDLLFDALEPLPQRNQDEALTLMRKGTTLAKSMITTYNPLFGLANLARDLPTGFINSRTRKNPIGYLSDYIGSALDIILKRPIYQEYLNMGGGGQVSQFAGIEPRLTTTKTAKSFTKLEPNDVLGRINRSAVEFLDKIDMFNNAIESASRLAEYKRVLKVMGDTPEARQMALNNSDEITINFFKRGSAQRINTLDTFYPYFNASIQALANPFTQSQGGNLAPMLGKAVFSMMLPSVLSYLFLKDDPDYQKLDQRTKDDFLITPYKDSKGAFIKIPLSREFAIPLHAIPIRILDSYLKQKPEIFSKDLLTGMLRNYSPLNPIEGSIVSPIGRTYMSKQGSDWLGRPILNREDLQLPAELQYDENTSAPAKLMGKLFGLSPKKLDAMGMSYLGGIAQIGIPLTSQSGATFEPTKPLESGKSILQGLYKVGAKRFTADPLYNTDVLNEHYNKFDEVQKQVKTLEHNNEKVPFKLANELKRLNKINTRIADLRRVKNKISADKKLVSDDRKVLNYGNIGSILKLSKEDQLRELQRKMLQIASNSVQKGEIK
jgi:hypothetical protein